MVLKRIDYADAACSMQASKTTLDGELCSGIGQEGGSHLWGILNRFEHIGHVNLFVNSSNAWVIKRAASDLYGAIAA